jgi:hypothetical protein
MSRTEKTIITLYAIATALLAAQGLAEGWK